MQISFLSEKVNAKRLSTVVFCLTFLGVMTGWFLTSETGFCTAQTLYQKDAPDNGEISLNSAPNLDLPTENVRVSQDSRLFDRQLSENSLSENRLPGAGLADSGSFFSPLSASASSAGTGTQNNLQNGKQNVQNSQPAIQNNGQAIVQNIQNNSAQNNLQNGQNIQNSQKGYVSNGQNVQQRQQNNVLDSQQKGQTNADSSPKILLLVFESKNCPGSKKAYPLLEEMIQKKYPIRFVDIESEQNREIIQQYAVRSTPTFLMFLDGQEVDRYVGQGESNVVLQPQLLRMFQQTVEKVRVRSLQGTLSNNSVLPGVNSDRNSTSRNQLKNQMADQTAKQSAISVANQAGNQTVNQTAESNEIQGRIRSADFETGRFPLQKNMETSTQQVSFDSVQPSLSSSLNSGETVKNALSEGVGSQKNSLNLGWNEQKTVPGFSSNSETATPAGTANPAGTLNDAGTANNIGNVGNVSGVLSQNRSEAPDATRLISPLIAASVRISVHNEDDDQSIEKGTGTIIHCSRTGEALVATCGHLFRTSKGTGRTEVELFEPTSGKPVTVEGECVYYDGEVDIAFVGIPLPFDVKPIPLVPQGYSAKEGDRVVSVGCSSGNLPSLLRHKVLSTDRMYYEPRPQKNANGEPIQKNRIYYINTDNAPSQGRSGGGLFVESESGYYLLGVCNAGDPKSDDGLFLPTNVVYSELLLNKNLEFVYQDLTR